jgi:hypothetical protein
MLRRWRRAAAGAFSNGTSVLRFYGTANEARALAGRRLHFEHADGRGSIVCTNHATDFSSTALAPRTWSVPSIARRLRCGVKSSTKSNRPWPSTATSPMPRGKAERSRAGVATTGKAGRRSRCRRRR